MQRIGKFLLIFFSSILFDSRLKLQLNRCKLAELKRADLILISRNVAKNISGAEHLSPESTSVY